MVLPVLTLIVRGDYYGLLVSYGPRKGAASGSPSVEDSFLWAAACPVHSRRTFGIWVSPQIRRCSTGKHVPQVCCVLRLSSTMGLFYVGWCVAPIMHLRVGECLAPTIELCEICQYLASCWVIGAEAWELKGIFKLLNYFKRKTRIYLATSFGLFVHSSVYRWVCDQMNRSCIGWLCGVSNTTSVKADLEALVVNGSRVGL